MGLPEDNICLLTVPGEKYAYQIRTLFLIQTECYRQDRQHIHRQTDRQTDLKQQEQAHLSWGIKRSYNAYKCLKHSSTLFKDFPIKSDLFL